MHQIKKNYFHFALATVNTRKKQKLVRSNYSMYGNVWSDQRGLPEMKKKKNLEQVKLTVFSGRVLDTFGSNTDKI